MVAAAMESKRIGLSHKSLFVVPNHLTEQMATETLKLYPGANVLVATKRDFETKNRKKFCAKIATGDYEISIDFFLKIFSNKKYPVFRPGIFVN